MASLDPAEGLDPFSRVLPLPFRLQLEFILGIWLWALNLHGFHRAHIDVVALLRLPPRPSATDDSPDAAAPLHTAVYRLAALLTTFWTVFIVAFWLLTAADPAAVTSHAWIPNLLFFCLAALLFCPRYPIFLPLFRARSAPGLARWWTGARRIALGGIAKPKPEKFGDVLLADALTSYAKPLSEVLVVACMVLVRRAPTTAMPDRRCGYEVLVPAAILWPFVVRLRQCVKEGQWANAAKYATAFPVVVLSSLARGDAGWTAAWRLAAVVNSLYSFWWDVSMDWDLTLLSTKRHASPYGLRQHRVFGRPLLYYAVVMFDLVLRFAWSMKLSLHLVYLDGIEGGIFLMEVLELCRRWVWVYFRVETEWVRSMPSANIEL